MGWWGGGSTLCALRVINFSDAVASCLDGGQRKVEVKGRELHSVAVAAVRREEEKMRDLPRCCARSAS